MYFKHYQLKKTAQSGYKLKMLRILHVLWNARFGGIQRLALDLASVQFTDSNKKVAMLFGNEEGKGEFLEEIGEIGLNCHFLGLKSGFDSSPWKYLKAIRIFQSYDILHFHVFNPMIAVAAVLSGRKIVYTFHGVFGFGRKRKKTERLNEYAEKVFVNRFVDYATFNSIFSKRIAQQRFGLHRVENSVIYNGSRMLPAGTVPKFSERKVWEQTKGKFIVGTSSRFAGFKRIDRLIKAFFDFQKEKDAVLLLVGDGALKSQLQNMVQKIQLSEKTIFTGYKKNVREYQGLMDVCVFPSENEPFGLVAVEALSLGKPTIVFNDGGGITEVVAGLSKDDIVDDISQLVDRLNFYYYNREEIEKNVKKRIEYSKKFDINNMSEEFEVIYRNVLLQRIGSKRVQDTKMF